MLGVVVLVAIVPLSTLAATGRLRDAWAAFRGYGVFIGALGLLIGAGAAVALIAHVFSS